MDAQSNIKQWYQKEYPTDELGEELNPTLTFAELYAAMQDGADCYLMLNAFDSLVRERVF